jgi:hypothetical protein
MDGEGFFGPNRLYHYWQLKRHQQHQKLDGKIGYWLFVKEMKEFQKMNELKQRAATRVRNEQATGA